MAHRAPDGRKDLCATCTPIRPPPRPGIACHNRNGRDAQVLARRVAANVPVGKQWSQPQLLGRNRSDGSDRARGGAGDLPGTHDDIPGARAARCSGCRSPAIYTYHDIRRKQALAERFERYERYRWRSGSAERTTELRLAVRELESFSYSVSHDCAAR
jgi:hypothetical protein